MIVPRNRLLFWVIWVVLPFGLVATLGRTGLIVALAGVSTLVVLALADALRSGRVFAGLSVDLPGVNRLSKDRPGKLEIRIRNERQTARNIRLALALPPEIECPQADAVVALAGGSEWFRLGWPCVPRRRGRYRLDVACLETPSPLGFWNVRKAFPVKAEVRVYPNMLAERKSLAAVFLNRTGTGLHTQRQVGKGRDFEKLREYIPGDSYDEIHWKATAKRSRPVTKVFQIERTQEVYVIVDASRLSARNVAKAVPASATAGIPTTDEGEPQTDTLLERYVTASLMLGLVAERQGDLFGLMAFSDRIETFLRARNGPAHYQACRDALYTLQPRIVSPDYDEVFSFIRLRLRRRALLVILTALDDAVLAESFVKNVELIRRQHLVLVNVLPPPGVAPLFTQPETKSLDEMYQHLGGHLRWAKLRELEKVLQRRGVKLSLLRTEQLSADIVTQYLNVKQRQSL